EAHGGFPGYYPAVSTLVFYPWSSLLPAAIVLGWSRRKSNPDVRFLLGWVVGPLILLECFQTKLIHYYLPAFPACSLLVASLFRALHVRKCRLRCMPYGRLGVITLVGVGLGLPCVLVAGTALMPGILRPGLFAIAGLVAMGTLVGARLLRQDADDRAI